MKLRYSQCLYTTVLLAVAFICPGTAPAADVEVGGQKYATIQEAIDAHPGQMIFLPGGDHVISQAIVIKHSGSGLYGGARIVQDNPAQDIIRVEGANDVRVRDLTLTRAEGTQDAPGKAAVWAEKCDRLELSGLQVHENRSSAGSISLLACRQSRVSECLVNNYKTLAIDDRSKSDLYGFAFKAIDGTGIQIRECVGVQVINNRVIETTYIPTKENRDKYDLGTLTIMPEKPGRLMQQDIFDTRYTNNWHQGAGLQVSSPTQSDFITITGNYFENAAQGMDIHADHVIISNNHVNRAMIGMKTMHGAKHVLISSNQFSYCDLWGLKLMPGALSHVACAAADDKPARDENTDGGTIVANNIFTHFGLGDQRWNWEGRKPEYPERNVIAVLFGQLEDNPPITDIIITGNLVYDSGKNQVLIDGQPQVVGPKYYYALYVEPTRQPAPRRVLAKGNLFDPGINGASNLPLVP